jgi:AcrR family transcriptional regulator
MMDGMGRWKPDGRRRLQEAAMALYAERGYAEVTAADVAERAGLTERTFFRYFADKKEVLFGGETALRETLVGGVESTPADRSPLEAALAGLEALAEALQPRREQLLVRARILSQSPELRERELAKVASWSAALEASLRERGLPAESAAYAAEASVAVFRVAVHRWLDASSRASLPGILREGFAAVADFLGIANDG